MSAKKIGAEPEVVGTGGEVDGQSVLVLVTHKRTKISGSAAGRPGMAKQKRAMCAPPFPFFCSSSSSPIPVGMVMALIEAVYDKDESARRILQESLFTIGKRQPILVLSSCEALVNEENGGDRCKSLS